MIRNFSGSRLYWLQRALITAILISPFQAIALDTDREDVQAFITELTSQHQFDESYVQDVLARSKVQQSILDAMSRPAEKVKPWHEYRAIFITDKRIEAGVAFYAEHRETLERIEQETGVPPEMVLGIIGVESYYGRITGKNRVVDALVTLGFDYPPRSKFFRSELGHVFQLAREEDLDIDALVGSYAGAMGPPQFIPSSYRAYAVDGDGDGKRDLLNNWQDILASVANYFAVHKWQPGQPVASPAQAVNADITPNEKLKPRYTVGKLSDAGVSFDTALANSAKADLWKLEGKAGSEYWVGYDNLYVITRYNRSIMYALATWELGNAVVEEAGE